MIERAVILSSGETISTADLGETIRPSSEIQIGGHFTLDQIEHAHIQRVVETSKTLEQAAEILGIDPATLYRKRKKNT